MHGPTSNIQWEFVFLQVSLNSKAKEWNQHFQWKRKGRPFKKLKRERRILTFFTASSFRSFVTGGQKWLSFRGVMLLTHLLRDCSLCSTRVHCPSSACKFSYFNHFNLYLNFNDCYAKVPVIRDIICKKIPGKRSALGRKWVSKSHSISFAHHHNSTCLAHSN